MESQISGNSDSQKWHPLPPELGFVPQMFPSRSWGSRISKWLEVPVEGVIVPAFCFELSVQRRFCRGLFRPFTLPSHTITGLPLAVIFRIHAQPFSSIPAISFDTTG